MFDLRQALNWLSAGRLIGEGLTIACGSGAVRLTQVQREGKGAMDAATFLRGAGTLPSAVS